MLKKLCVFLAVGISLGGVAGCKNGLEENEKDLSEYDLTAYMSPFWEGDIVYNETAMVLKNEDGSISPVGLMYEIGSVIAVRNYGLDTLYEEGKDYEVQNGKLVIKDNGAIYSDMALDYDQYYFPEYDGSNNLASNGGGILKTEASNGAQGLCKWQLSVTYTHEKTDSPIGVPRTFSDKFSKTIAKLKSGEKTNLVCLGDSISAGWSASGYQYCNIAPLCPPYFNLVTDYLGMYYENENIDAANFSVGGMKTDWGREDAQIQSVVKENPDLLIIAFGMNDGVSGGFSPAAYKENTLAIIDGVRAGCSDTEIILVSPMLPNAEAANMLVNQYNYVAVLNEIASERGNVAVADVGTLSFRLLQLKKFRDMSANNINHPNDFMHRLYAQTIVKTIADIL